MFTSNVHTYKTQSKSETSLLFSIHLLYTTYSYLQVLTFGSLKTLYNCPSFFFCLLLPFSTYFSLKFHDLFRLLNLLFYYRLNLVTTISQNMHLIMVFSRPKDLENLSTHCSHFPSGFLSFPLSLVF